MSNSIFDMNGDLVIIEDENINTNNYFDVAVSREY
jgi:hypothetical protein